MQEIGKYVFFLGTVLVVLGGLAWRFPNLFQWFGKLPGDISIQKGHFSFYFPIVTCIVISILLTVVSWLFRR
jgi:thiosulfate reductase cytochrome b subunit